MLSFYFLLPPVLYLQISYNLQSSTFSEIEKLMRKLISLLLHLEAYSCGFDRASQEAQVDTLFVFVYFYVGKILILWWLERALADADEFIGSLYQFPRWQIRSSFQEMFSFLEIQVDNPTVKSEKHDPVLFSVLKMQRIFCVLALAIHLLFCVARCVTLIHPLSQKCQLFWHYNESHGKRYC